MNGNFYMTTTTLATWHSWLGPVNRTQKLALRTFFFCFSLFVGWSIYTRVILPSGAFGWDEAAHALRGLIIADDIKQGDWLGFLYDSYRQVYWPPGHSWLTGIAFLIGEPSTVTARAVSLISFVMAASAIYLAALQLTKRNSELAAIIAGTLFMTSPSLITFASLSMLEIPGLLFLILTFLAYFKLSHAPGSPPRPYVLLGLAITATYFIRSNYAILVFLAIFINSLIEAEFRPQSLLTRNNLYAVLPMLVVFPIWFAYPPKLIDTWRMLINQPVGVTDPFSLGGFLFYPLAFFRVSGSVWTFALLLSSLVLGLRFRHDKNIRFLIALVLIQVFIGQVHQTKVDRYVFPAMPALFLLAGYVFARWWNSGNQGKTRMWSWGPRLAVAVIFCSSVNLFVNSLRPSSMSYDSDVIRYIAAAAPENDTTLLIGSMDMHNPSPPVLDWHLAVEQDLMAATQSGATVDWEVVQKLAANLNGRVIPTWLSDTILPVLSRGEHSRRIRSLYLGLPSYASYSQSPEAFNAFLPVIANTYPFDCAIVITSLAPEARYPVDFIDPGLQRIGLQSVSNKKFQTGNIRVDVYRRVT